MYLVIGQGAAGASAANTLRRLDTATPITIVTAEKDYCYNRVDLPDILAGKYEPSAAELQGVESFRSLGISCRMGTRVQAVHPQEKIVQLASGEALKYTKLLLATGSKPIIPRLPGLDARGIHTLWTMEQARAISGAASRSSSAVVIGAGLIGLKAGLALASRGLRVTIVERLPRVMPRQLDGRAATIISDALRQAGIELLLDTEVRSIVAEDGVVSGVKIGARRLACEIVLLAVGVKPNTELAEAAGLSVNFGIIVNRNQQTSVPEIYAAGDAAETSDSLTGGPKVPGIWPVAIRQGEVAAHNMAGYEMFYDSPPAMNAVEIAGVPLVSMGDIEGAPGDEVLTTQAGNSYRRLVLRDRTIRGVLCLGDIRQAGVIGAQMIRQTELADPSLLASPQFSFAHLIDA
jgi:NAD(P)H-nitrite reductase large subunit